MHSLLAKFGGGMAYSYLIKTALFSATVLIATGIAARPASAALIDVQFAGVNRQTGAVLVGSAGDYWNFASPGTVGQQSAEFGHNVPLFSSDSTASGLSLSYSSNLSYTAYPGYTQFTNTPYANLMQGILVAPLQFMIIGLISHQQFNLYDYTQGDDSANGRNITMTVNGVTQTDRQTNADTFIANNNYALFFSTADAAGTIVLSTTSTNEGDFNGFQLQTIAIPESESILLLTVGPAGIGLVRRWSRNA